MWAYIDRPARLASLAPPDRYWRYEAQSTQRKRRNRRVFVVQLLNSRDEWAQLREFDNFDETVAYLKHLKAHDKVTNDDIEYSTT